MGTNVSPWQWAAMSDIIGIVGWELKKDEHTSLQRLIDKVGRCMSTL
jgi:hypothetical protein